MKTFGDSKLRIRVNVESFDNPVDVIRGGIPQYWRGNDLRIEVGIFSKDDVVDVANFSDVLLDVRALNNDGEAPSASVAALMSGKCTLLDNSVTMETWQSGTAQHALFAFTAEETSLLPGDYWMVLWTTTNDFPAKTLTLGAGLIHVLESGCGASSMPPDPMLTKLLHRR